MLLDKDIETIKMCLNRVYSILKGDTVAQIKSRKDIEETIKNLDNYVEQFKKQIFQLGDTVYWYDDDYKYFESVINAIFLNNDGTYDYSTNDIDFSTNDIGNWVFKTKEERSEKVNY